MSFSPCLRKHLFIYVNRRTVDRAQFLKMGQHGGTGHRPALATRFCLLLPFTLIFLPQFFEPRNSPQTFLVPFHLFLTSLTPTTGTITCSPTTQKPTQATYPSWAFPRTSHYISLAPKLYYPQSFVRRPFVVDSMLGFSPRPILWQTWWDQPSDSVPHAPSTSTREPHSSHLAFEPALFHSDHPCAPWTSRSHFLPAPADTKSGHTALNPLSSSRNETFTSLALGGSDFNPLSHSHAPSNPVPAEITCVHFVRCIYNPHLLAQPATPLLTLWKGEIEHESWWIYFLSKILQFFSFLHHYAPTQGVLPSPQPKHYVFATETAILRSQSESRDPFCFLCSHWPRHRHHYPPSIGDPQHNPPSIGDP